MPAPKRIGITVDCPDAAELATFWERCLGYTRRPGASGGPYVTLERGDGSPDGPPLLTFQTVPETEDVQSPHPPRPLRGSGTAARRRDASGRRLVRVPRGCRRVDDTRAPGPSRERVLRHRTRLTEKRQHPHLGCFSALGGIRTPNLLIRSQM